MALVALLAFHGDFAFAAEFDFDAEAESLESDEEEDADDDTDDDLFSDDEDEEEELDESLFGEDEDEGDEKADEKADADEELDADEEEEPVWDPDDVSVRDIDGHDWQFDHNFRAPRPIKVYGPDDKAEIYWYILYTVTNNTGDERFFAPSFMLFTDKAKVQRSRSQPNVCALIKKDRPRHAKFLEHATKIIGKLLQGDDNARDGIAIFAPLEEGTKSFTVFVGGLTGQYIRRANPGALADATEAEKTVILHKTRALKYRLIGDEWKRDMVPAKLVRKWWAWR